MARNLLLTLSLGAESAIASPSRAGQICVGNLLRRLGYVISSKGLEEADSEILYDSIMLWSHTHTFRVTGRPETPRPTDCTMALEEMRRNILPH